MCGIFGLITPGLRIDIESCQRATRTLSHRGPDGAGVAFGRLGSETILSYPSDSATFEQYYDCVDQPDWFLGHRRLAIVDLAANASQPMCTTDRRCWVVFNGEIYNHRELRAVLASKGYRFLTDHSDTEVLLHGYREWGAELVDRLRGMFAFGLIDLDARCMLLARDWFGEKPLYTACDRRGICFASEPRALIASGFVDSRISASGLSDYLTFGYVPAPRTIFASINKMAAAERAVVDLSSTPRVVPRRYWDLNYHEQRATDINAWNEQFDHLLADAVCLRLDSDVPLGAFLSGGLDSTSVVQKMAECGVRPRTFTASFSDEDFDESAYASLVSRECLTTHHAARVEPGCLRAALEAIPSVFDEPFADASAIPMLAVAKMAREHVSVALSGDGGDELLGGYTRYGLNLKLTSALNGRFAWALQPLGKALTRVWPEHLKGRGLVRLMVPDTTERYRLLISDDSLAKRTQMGASDLTAFRMAWDVRTPQLLNRMCKADLRLYLPEDLMTKVDRACMAVGLEPRAPFLDKPLFEFVAAAPHDIWFAIGQPKRPLRQSVARSLGESFASRPKRGFAVPLGKWFRNELHDMIFDVLDGSSTFVTRLFSQEFIRGLLRAHINGSRDLSASIWTLLVLQRWHERFAGDICDDAA